MKQLRNSSTLKRVNEALHTCPQVSCCTINFLVTMYCVHYPLLSCRMQCQCHKTITVGDVTIPKGTKVVTMSSTTFLSAGQILTSLILRDMFVAAVIKVTIFIIKLRVTLEAKDNWLTCHLAGAHTTVLDSGLLCRR